jgi:hypothetical protein
LANKRYQSIIRLFEHCGISYNEALNPVRIKKQVTVEFSHSGTGFVEVDHHTYNKEDVFEEIQHPDFERRLGYHQRIWQHPHLLQMLESDEGNMLEIKAEMKNFENDDYFDGFFSPYFAEPFNNISRGLLQSKNLGMLGVWLELEPFIQLPEREEAFRSIRLFLDEQFRLLKNVNSENYFNLRPQLIVWIDTEWYRFFNSLPEEYHEIRERISIKLINLTVALQRPHRQDCLSISYQLINVENLSQNARLTILQNHAAYTNSGSAKASTSSSDSGSYTWIFWVLLIIIKFVVFSRGCN